MADKISGYVYVSSSYGDFKRLEGNRTVISTRKKKIINSVKEVGWLPIPILVNENMEIVDGGARFEVAKEKGFPIYYTIVNNLGLKECVAINVSSTNWTVFDYINSFADNGNKNYERLLTLINEYGKSIPYMAIYNAATELQADGKLIKSGNFYLPQERYEQADAALRYALRFTDVFPRVSGRNYLYYIVTNFCFLHNAVDLERLVQKVHERAAEFFPAINQDQAFQQIEDMYNHAAKASKTYLLTKYKMYMDSKYAWYKSKYMEPSSAMEK